MNYHKLDDTTLNITLLQNSKTQSEAVIYYIQKMDIEMVDLILDKDKTYQDMPKSVFIEKLNETVAVFRLNDNDKLIGYAGFCNSDVCPNSCKNGYAFIGNHSMHSMNLIFEVKEGIIQDLFECEEFQLLTKEIPLEDYPRIYIDISIDGQVNPPESPFDFF